MAAAHRETLRQMIRDERGILVPGAANALAARIIGDLGFGAIYLSGAGVTNSYLGLPDLGFMDLTQLSDHVLAIRGISDLPLIVDGETGFGNALNVAHMVSLLERAGASAVQIEDQRLPKRCGHFRGKELITTKEMIGKVRAAVDSRRDGLVIIARTDAYAVEGFDASIERAQSYLDAGADMTFVEAPVTLADMEAIPRLLAAPQMLNLVLGGKTPLVDARSAAKMGFTIILYANAALQGAIAGMQSVLGKLMEKGLLEEKDVTSFSERQRLVGKDRFDRMEQLYKDSP